MAESCTNPEPTSGASEALSWALKALRTERVLRALERTECGVVRED